MHAPADTILAGGNSRLLKWLHGLPRRYRRCKHRDGEVPLLLEIPSASEICVPNQACGSTAGSTSFPQV